MMDHVKILKRALDTTWRYRALWIFGIILALTTGGGSGGGGLCSDGLHRLWDDTESSTIGLGA